MEGFITILIPLLEARTALKRYFIVCIRSIKCPSEESSSFPTSLEAPLTLTPSFQCRPVRKRHCCSRTRLALHSPFVVHDATTPATLVLPAALASGSIIVSDHTTLVFLVLKLEPDHLGPAHLHQPTPIYSGHRDAGRDGNNESFAQAYQSPWSGHHDAQRRGKSVLPSLAAAPTPFWASLRMSREK